VSSNREAEEEATRPSEDIFHIFLEERKRRRRGGKKKAARFALSSFYAQHTKKHSAKVSEGEDTAKKNVIGTMMFAKTKAK
jgi:hypothetical protein